MADPASLRPEAREPTAPQPLDASARATRPAPPMATAVPLSSPIDILTLQRHVVNRTVQRLLAHGTAPRMRQRTKNLRNFAKGSEMVSQKGKNLYYIIPINAAAHVSVILTSRSTSSM